ncbi:MAG TPA: sulfur carrier protein ThiS [Myxococcaceae bacterium]|nr:sulfur carrier protein ThiS [Myxococcaceae bacterium]
MDSDLKLLVNGEAREVPDGTTILALLDRLEIPCEQVAVEVNHQVIRRARHAEHRLASGDQVEIVSFVGGG